MSLFNDCFGDLSQGEQGYIKHILNTMTRKINEELLNKPYKGSIIQLPEANK